MPVNHEQMKYEPSFDVSRFRAKDGRLRVLVVYKKSRLQLYTEKETTGEFKQLMEKGDESVSHLEGAHVAHEACFEYIKEILSGEKFDVEYQYRTDLDKDIALERVVVTVGGDGTLLDASHYVTDSPILGINSDPERSVGSLCAATMKNARELIEGVERGTTGVQHVMRVGGKLDGKDLPYVATNDLLISHRNPAATTRYLLHIGKTVEVHRSSGIWIATPAGSTSAICSAGGAVQPLDDSRIQLKVREAYFADSQFPRLLWQYLYQEDEAQIVSKMPGGQIFFDGPYRSVPFPLGARFEISCRVPPLLLFVTDDMEARRRKIGHLRAEYQRRLAIVG